MSVIVPCTQAGSQAKQFISRLTGFTTTTTTTTTNNNNSNNNNNNNNNDTDNISIFLFFFLIEKMITFYNGAPRAREARAWTQPHS